MRFIAHTIVLLSSVLAFGEEDGVLSLTAQNFVEKVEKAPPTRTFLVDYYAPWCGHCKKLAPDYAKVAKYFKDEGKDKDMILASLNCESNDTFCKEKGIGGYPTLKFYKDGRTWPYEGPRDEKGMIDYIKKQLMPSVSSVTPDQLDKFSKSNDVVVMASFPPGSEGYKVLEKVAERVRNEVVVGNLASGSISLFKKFDEGHVEYTGPIEEKALYEWVSNQSIPSMADIDQRLYTKFMGGDEKGKKKPLVYFFHDKPEQKETSGKIVEGVARKFKEKVNSVYIDGKLFGQHMVALNGEANKYPSILVHNVEDDMKFDFGNQEITEANVEKFYADLVAGKLTPKYKSEPVPKQKDSEPIKVVVNENFVKEVLDPKKDVFIEIYATWCGVCKRLAPVFEKLGRVFKDHQDKIRIVKMDGDLNDPPREAKIQITGYPTFALYKAGSTEPILMNPTDDLDKMVSFILENSTNKVDVSKALKAVKEEKADEKKETKEEKAEL